MLLAQSIPYPTLVPGPDALSWHGHSPAAKRRASARPAASRTTGPGPMENTLSQRQMVSVFFKILWGGLGWVMSKNTWPSEGTPVLTNL